MEGRHVGLDFYDLLIEALSTFLDGRGLLLRLGRLVVISKRPEVI